VIEGFPSICKVLDVIPNYTKKKKEKEKTKTEIRNNNKKNLWFQLENMTLGDTEKDNGWES
jgi:hypothetical protein